VWGRYCDVHLRPWNFLLLLPRITSSGLFRFWIDRSLFNDAVRTATIALRQTAWEKNETIAEEAVVVYFQVLFQHSPGERFEVVTCRAKARHVTAYGNSLWKNVSLDSLDGRSVLVHSWVSLASLCRLRFETRVKLDCSLLSSVPVNVFTSTKRKESDNELIIMSNEAVKWYVPQGSCRTQCTLSNATAKKSIFFFNHLKPSGNYMYYLL
jgi:hypothetical protein